MAEQGLKELFIDELRDLYNAENQLVKALPKMAKASESPELKSGFEEHFEQTKGHVKRLENIFSKLGEKPKGEKCKGMEGLVKRARKRSRNIRARCAMLPSLAGLNESSTTRLLATEL
jgi:ferritin-like metal-binding protein YciE